MRRRGAALTPQLTPNTLKECALNAVKIRCFHLSINLTARAELRARYCVLSLAVSGRQLAIAAGIGLAAAIGGRGRRSVKVAPSPSALRTETSPPINCASDWVITKPNPVPP